MKKIEKYYDNTQTNLPHKNVKKLIEIEPNVGKAIDLVYGAGRDTVYLIQERWYILAVDKEDVKQRIKKRLKPINKLFLIYLLNIKRNPNGYYTVRTFFD